MLNRRTLFGAGAAITSFMSSSIVGRKASAGNLSYDVEPRGTTGKLERLPRLELESLEDFHTGFRIWVNRDLTKVAMARADKILEEHGMDPKTEVSTKEALELLGNDPIIGTRMRTWTSTQEMMWRNLLDEFHGNAEEYLAEMEAADYSGPGTLELNPEMEIPEYTRHEIHNQPGGYVGDPFAGHVYHYGTNNFYTGRNNQDELHVNIANATPGPISGSVNRILDLGCSCGQLSVALKQRFPEAEVWGVDIGGPMVRYAHMRAADIGVDVNFAQRLAEDTKFPDNHFDIVTSYIMHHELSAEASKQVFAETFRVLRPGGVYYPVDFFTSDRKPDMSAYRRIGQWWNHRWNVEVWYYEYEGLDFEGEMSKVGFEVKDGPSTGRYNGGNVMAVKPV